MSAGKVEFDAGFNWDYDAARIFKIRSNWIFGDMNMVIFVAFFPLSGCGSRWRAHGP